MIRQGVRQGRPISWVRAVIRLATIQRNASLTAAADLLTLPADADPRDALRHATAHLHAQVDATMPLSGPSPTLADYRAHLLLLADWTTRLRRFDVDATLLDTQARTLADDLARCDALLGTASSAAPAAELESVSTPDAFGWGIAYVIEGSQLGGQVMYRRLAASLAPHPLTYLKGAGSATGARWTTFLRDLRAHVQTPDDHLAACRGAVEAFELLLRCQREAAPR